MFLGKVAGTVWATKKEKTLNGYKFLQVCPLNINLEPEDSVSTVIDNLGAGAGDIVMCVGGSAARKWLGTDDLAFEGAVIGIVDEVHTDKELIKEIFLNKHN